MALNSVPLTVEGKRRLEAELDELKASRGDVVERLRNAQQSGLAEFDAEYEDAKQEQALLESRIRDLEATLARAVLIDEAQAHSANHVQVGSGVEVEQDGRVKHYQIVGGPEADAARGRISNESPVGRALLGKKVGDTVEVNVPRGVIKLSIRKID